MGEKTWDIFEQALKDQPKQQPDAASKENGQSSENGVKKSEEQAGSFNNWEGTNFGNDKTNEKFRRLMGIKNASSPASNSCQQDTSSKWFADQEQQYEKARAIHTGQRGLGLGFGSSEEKKEFQRNDPEKRAGISMFKGTAKRKVFDDVDDD